MDFYKIRERATKRGEVEIYPDFIIKKSQDILIQGRAFKAIWDEEKGLWSTNEYDVARIIDEDQERYLRENANRFEGHAKIRYMSSYSSKSWLEFKNYITKIADNSTQLDPRIIFSNNEVNKKDYATRKLDYPLKKGKMPAYNKMMNVLYSPEEREKIEWAIGAIITGDAKKIQKFIVLFGDPGTGKSTVLDIIQEMFEGYYAIFDAKSLTSNNNAFSTEQFKTNPLIAIQHDGDLSRIEDNSKLNSIVSHEKIVINEKYKSSYYMDIGCFLFMATNKPVKITDAKAGLIRRLIDVRPTGNHIEENEFIDLREQIHYELGAIAYHCKEVYEKLGKNYYAAYRPTDMMYKTDIFFNFVENYDEELTAENGITLKKAYAMYKRYCEDSGIEHKLPMYTFREELKNYFENYEDRTYVDGVAMRSYYSGFLKEKFDRKTKHVETKPRKGWINFKDQESLFDIECRDCDAQYANEKETPSYKWENVKTKLLDIDTKKLHYVKVPSNLIVIDFDIRDENGNKCLEKNLEEANKFPKTYAETSKSGQGIHLHYYYDGDVDMLSRIYSDDIEIKVFTGNSSLRRMLVLCNDIQIATISSGLPLREIKKGENVVDFEVIKSEKLLRTMIKKNLNKEYHNFTKPSVDFIKKLLDDAYNSGMSYDVRDLRTPVLIFASESKNQADTCIKLVNEMHFCSDDHSEAPENKEDEPIIFYDVEVFPNLFLINWKKIGEGNPIVRMINPSPEEVERLCKHNLVGFNCRRYDNHMLYARMMGYSNLQLYNLSQKIVCSKKGENKDAFFGEAYNISYTDIYDYSTKKQSLKKWEIELKPKWNLEHPNQKIMHHELGLDWNQPVPEELWPKVAEYCDDDVLATEAVWEATQVDFTARKMLVAICKHAGLDACVNDTTNSLTTKIVFGRDRHPELEYTDLTKEFPGYSFIECGEDKHSHNMYKGEDAGFGGYVWVDPGMYIDVALLDISSMHPHSILAMNCFGEYTQRFRDIVDARIAIKHKDYAKVKTMLDGALEPFVENDEQADILSTALKIPINSVYGLTSAKFDNPFRDSRNVNNIVALRGALFMITLKEKIIEMGYKPIHFKTDSVKIANADQKIIDFCMDFARKYGYEFEHEATYSKICIVNGSTYIAKYDNFGQRNKGGKHANEWTATAAQFQHPYVFKKLFSKEPITVEDLVEVKEVKGTLYLDLNEGLPNVKELEKARTLWEKVDEDPSKELSKKDSELLANIKERFADISKLDKAIDEGHSYKFVGKIGEFCPVLPGTNGGELMRFDNDKYSYATGAKDYRWKEADDIRQKGLEDEIDMSYFNKLVDEAVTDISEYGDFEWFAEEKEN